MRTSGSARATSTSSSSSPTATPACSKTPTSTTPSSGTARATMTASRKASARAGITAPPTSRSRLQTSALVAGTSLFVQRSIGAARARALALLAEPLAAETAAQWGLIWKCVDDADLLATGRASAQKLADGPLVALGLIKKQLEFAWTAPLAPTLDSEATA